MNFMRAASPTDVASNFLYQRQINQTFCGKFFIALRVVKQRQKGWDEGDELSKPKSFAVHFCQLMFRNESKQIN